MAVGLVPTVYGPTVAPAVVTVVKLFSVESVIHIFAPSKARADGPVPAANTPSAPQVEVPVLHGARIFLQAPALSAATGANGARQRSAAGGHALHGLVDGQLHVPPELDELDAAALELVTALEVETALDDVLAGEPPPTDVLDDEPAPPPLAELDVLDAFTDPEAPELDVFDDEAVWLDPLLVLTVDPPTPLRPPGKSVNLTAQAPADTTASAPNITASRRMIRSSPASAKRHPWAWPTRPSSGS
jgi:hypothetical protein